MCSLRELQALESPLAIADSNPLDILQRVVKFCLPSESPEVTSPVKLLTPSKLPYSPEAPPK